MGGSERDPEQGVMAGANGREDARALLGRPWLRTVALGFLVVALLLAVLGVQLYRAAWADAWREVHDKHRVLAINLAKPVSGYVQDRRYTVASIAASLSGDSAPGERLAAAPGGLLNAFQRGVDGIRSLTLLDPRGRLLHTSWPEALTPAGRRALADSSVFYSVVASGGDYLGGIAASPYDGEPSVMLGWPVRDPGGRLSAVLLGELSMAPVEAMRRAVRFGEGGHALVVDQFGRLVAHPSAAWMREMRDLSRLKVVRAALEGGTGVTEFYAPFAAADMVAGYAGVPGLGWGVVVPQPKAEIARRVRSLLYGQLLWVGLGMLLLVLLAYLLAAWFTRPLQRLASGLHRGGRGDPPP